MARLHLPRAILGTVEVYRAHHSQVPVKAIIFKHPVGPENEFDYSFGVFVPVYGSLGFCRGLLRPEVRRIL